MKLVSVFFFVYISEVQNKEAGWCKKFFCIVKLINEQGRFLFFDYINIVIRMEKKVCKNISEHARVLGT